MNRYSYEDPIFLIAECDGVRIISNEKCEFLQRVPSTYSSCSCTSYASYSSYSYSHAYSYASYFSTRPIPSPSTSTIPTAPTPSSTAPLIQIGANAGYHVADVTEEIFKIGSTAPAAMLYDAMEHFEVSYYYYFFFVEGPIGMSPTGPHNIRLNLQHEEGNNGCNTGWRPVSCNSTKSPKFCIDTFYYFFQLIVHSSGNSSYFN